MMKRIGIVLLYIFSLILFVFGIYGFVLHIVKDSNIWFIASLGVVLMVYTQLLKAFVNYYNTFLYDEIIFDDDDEYFYIELDDNEDGEVEKDEDEN